MKKSLLLTLVSLLVFNAVAWGEYTITLATSEVTVSGNNGISSQSLGGSASVKKITIEVRSKAKTYTNPFKIGTSSSGSTELYNGNCQWTSYPETTPSVNKTYDSPSKISTIYFKNTTAWALTSKDRYYKNVELTIVASNLEFGSVTAGSSATKKFDVFATSKPTLIYPAECSVSVSLKSGYCYEVSVTFKPTSVQEYSGNITMGEQVVATVSGTGSLPTPTNLGVVMDYTKAKLSWTAVSGAEKYIITYGDSTKTTTGTNIDCDGLHLGTQYTFSVKAFANNTSSAAAEISDKTKDLAASAYINVSNASYSSVEAQWAAIPDATGYYIVSNNGVVNVFEGHDVTSGTLVGLMPNNTYTFTVYGMYGAEVSATNKTSSAISTKETKCPVQSFNNKTVGNASGGGFNWDPKPYEITTEKNSPIVSFSYATSSSAATALGDDKKMFRVKEYVNGKWQNSSWSTDSKSGSVSVTLSRETRKIQLVFNGNFAATFSNVSVMQGSYLEVPETTVDFGNVAIGEKPSKDIVVNYSTMVGNVSKKGSDKFSTDKNQVGKDDCGYGSENIKVTFDGSEIGSYEGTITVGSVNVKVKANVTLQVPTLSASEITYNSAKLSWNAVDGAEKYKLNFIGGNSIETTDIYSVCDTLKLHSSNQFTVQAYGGGQYTDPSNVVTVDTPDLAASASFSVSNPSYSSADAQWAAVPDATGYRIVSNDGVVNVFDGGATTSGILVGLQPNKTYTFTVYGMYGNDVSNNGKASNEISTKETKCESQSVSNFTLKDCTGGGFDYSEAEQLITTDKNEPKISFSFEAKNLSIFPATGYKFTVKESSDNSNWSTAWTTEEGKVKSGTANVQLKRETRYIKVAYKGNFCGQFSNINIYQGSYLEASPETVDFGTAKVGQNVDAKTISVNYSTMEGDVISGNVERFQTSKSIVGADDCRYGIETFDVTANTEVEPGTYQADITVGTQKVPAKITIEALPAANITAAATGKSAISVQWDKVAGATGYKLTCADAGINVTLPDDGSEHYSYNATGLNECTQYTFTITSMYNAIENESASASATTYSTVKVEKAGAFAETTTFTLSGVEGQWNKDENSFASGSTATINASNSNVCAKFDKLTIGETEYTTLPQAFIVNAPATATIYYTAKELDAPVVTVNCGSKNSAELSWSAVECADSYTVYVNGVEAETGITATSYTATDLTPATDYTFVVKAVSGSLETASESATATTYGVIKVQVGGDATSTTDWTLTGEAGKWNETEESFEVGSDVSVLASNSDAGVIFDKIQYYGGESTDNPTTVTVLNASVAETWAGIYYKYNGVVELNGKVYDSLDEAAEAAMAEDGQMNLLQDVPSQDLNVNCYVKFNGNGHEIGNLYVKQNGDLEIVGGVQVVNDFGLEVTADHSGQFADAGNNLTVLGRAYIDKTLDPSGITNENKWYGVSFPFPVSSLEVFALVGGEEKPLTYYADYVFAAFDGNKRASSGKGFTMMKTGGATLEAGKFYMFATTTKTNTFRFYMKEGSSLVNPSKIIELYEYPSSSAKNAGWNNIGNSQLYHVGVESESTFAQIYINGENRYLTVDMSETALGVTSPMFIQQGENMSSIATLSRKNNGTLRSVEDNQPSVFNIQIKSSDKNEVADQLFIKTTTNRENEYTIGSDLMKFEISSTSPQIYTKAFDTNLSVYEALIINKQSDIPLYLYAPKSGNYILSLGKIVSDDINLYLVKNGTPIHNFTEDGFIEIALAKGTATGYSLRIEKADDIATNTDDDNNAPILYVENGNTLVISNLPDGKFYRIGNLSAEFKSYVSNGETIRITFIQKGTHWIEIDNVITKFEITK